MKFQPDKADASLIQAFDAHGIRVGQETISSSVVLGSQGERLDWGVGRFEDLTPVHFEQVARFKPELVIFGSGSSLRFPHPQLITSLMTLRIGVETMDSAAACRTYNILAGEGRHVVVALLL